MKKALILVALLLAVFVGEVLMYDKNSHAQDGKTFVAVSNFALYEIAKALLANEIEVKKLVPFGVEMHTYTPSVKTMMQAFEAELFIYSGLNMEPWINEKKSNYLDMSQFVQLHEVTEDVDDGHEHHGTKDPHYWLDIDNMITMTAVLSEQFQAHFPQIKAEIKAREKAYITELKALDKRYAQGLAHCQKREIVLNHAAFNYLGAKYHFHSHTLTGLSPDEQVSAKKMKEIIELVKTEKINTIFFESFVSDKVAKRIAKEVGIEAKALQPLANVTQEEASLGYIKIMQENLSKLRSAMECK